MIQTLQLAYESYITHNGIEPTKIIINPKIYDKLRTEVAEMFDIDLNAYNSLKKFRGIPIEVNLEESFIRLE